MHPELNVTVPLTECGASPVKYAGLGFDERLEFRGEVTVRFIPLHMYVPPSVVRFDLFSSFIDGTPTMSESQFYISMACPRAESRTNRLVLSVGKRNADAPEPVVTYAYELLVEYKIHMQRVPVANDFLDAIRAERDLRALGCAGGSFPLCHATGGGRFDLLVPLDLSRFTECLADGPGCFDDATFFVPTARTLTMSFQAPASTVFTVFDLKGSALATTRRPVRRADHRDAPILYSSLQVDVQAGWHVLEINTFDNSSAPLVVLNDTLIDDTCPLGWDGSRETCQHLSRSSCLASTQCEWQDIGCHAENVCAEMRSPASCEQGQFAFCKWDAKAERCYNATAPPYTCDDCPGFGCADGKCTPRGGFVPAPCSALDAAACEKDPECAPSHACVPSYGDFYCRFAASSAECAQAQGCDWDDATLRCLENSCSVHQAEDKCTANGGCVWISECAPQRSGCAECDNAAGACTGAYGKECTTAITRANSLRLNQGCSCTLESGCFADLFHPDDKDGYNAKLTGTYKYKKQKKKEEEQEEQVEQEEQEEEQEEQEEQEEEEKQGFFENTTIMFHFITLFFFFFCFRTSGVGVHDWMLCGAVWAADCALLMGVHLLAGALPRRAGRPVSRNLLRRPGKRKQKKKGKIRE